MKVQILRTDGERTFHHVPKAGALEWIRQQIGATTLDAVNLRNGKVMLVDDLGWNYIVELTETGTRHVPTTPRKALNPIATSLYRSVCRPGTTHQIAGDVAIVRDADFS